MKLPGGRGVSWDTSDYDANKIGTHVITVTASAGCATKDVSFDVVIIDPCLDADLTISPSILTATNIQY